MSRAICRRRAGVTATRTRRLGVRRADLTRRTRRTLGEARRATRLADLRLVDLRLTGILIKRKKNKKTFFLTS
jgi:hypothetical protein